MLHYAGTLRGTDLLVIDRLIMVDQYLITLAVAGVMLHVTGIGCAWGWLDRKDLFKVICSVSISIFFASFYLHKSISKSDVDIEDKKKPLVAAGIT